MATNIDLPTMDQPTFTFAIVPPDALIEHVWKISAGEDILSLRQVFQLSKAKSFEKYKDVLEELIESYMPHVFVGLFLGMMRDAHDSEDRAHRNMMFMMEYRHAIEGYDNDRQLIHPRNELLEKRFLRYFGHLPRALFVLCHRLYVRYPADIQAMHLLWACWEMKQHSNYSSPDMNVVMFLKAESKDKLMAHAVGIIRKLTILNEEEI